jgi:hypothetical protein
MFRTYNETTLTPYVIAENESFQVRAADSTKTLTFAETNKANRPNEILLKSNPEELALNVYDAHYHIWDMLSVKFTDEATDEEDNVDAGKPVNPDLNFYSWSSNHHPLAVDLRPFSNDKVIPLGLTSNYNQHFIIRVDNYHVPDGGQVYLHDKLLGTYTLLNQGTEYGFDVTKDGKTQGDQRFELGLHRNETVAQTGSLKVLMVPNPATSGVNVSYVAPKAELTKVRILTVEGVCVLSQDLGNQQSGSVTLPLDNLASGVYMVEFLSGTDRVVQRLVKE